MPCARWRARTSAPALLSEFVQSMTFPKVTRATVKERDRAPLESRRVRVSARNADRSRRRRARHDVARSTSSRWATRRPWQIADVERLSVISGLFRLALDTTTEYEVKNLVDQRAGPDAVAAVRATRSSSTTPDGPTALVLLGRGRLEFTPKAEAERGQVRIFSGAEALKTGVRHRVRARAAARSSARASRAEALTPRAGRSRRTCGVRRRSSTPTCRKSFQLDLDDLSAARWSLTPSSNDFVAEIVTGRYGPLTYARANSEPEDISFFDRRRHRNISVYPSEAKLATRGRFFSEDEKLDYDITRYEIETAFAPDRLWIDGTAKLSIHTRSAVHLRR